MRNEKSYRGERAAIMCQAAWVLLIALVPVAPQAGERPDCAFPVTDRVQPPSEGTGQPKMVTGSAKSYMQKQIDDPKKPPDWFANMHPPMPDVAAYGKATFACGSCHLPIGTGHDESAYIVGLPASYIVRQMADFKNGARKGFGIMREIAQALEDTDVQTAAAYFSALPTRAWLRVVETHTVPKTYVNPSNMRLALPGGGSEPIGSRIVELPEDENAAVARDPPSGFVAYAQKGSLAKGQALVTTGAGETIACTICHGPTLKGVETTPAVASRHTGYLVRQLSRVGRSAPKEVLMHAVVQPTDRRGHAEHCGLCRHPPTIVGADEQGDGIEI
jgi:cytochrome c553